MNAVTVGRPARPAWLTSNAAPCRAEVDPARSTKPVDRETATDAAKATSAPRETSLSPAASPGRLASRAPTRAGASPTLATTGRFTPPHDALSPGVGRDAVAVDRDPVAPNDVVGDVDVVSEPLGRLKSAVDRAVQATGRGLSAPDRGSQATGRGLSAPDRGSQATGRGLSAPDRGSQATGRGLSAPDRGSQATGRGLSAPDRGSQATGRGLSAPDRGSQATGRGL